LKEALGRDLDPTLRLDLAAAVLAFKDPAGLAALIDIFAGEATPRLAAEKAFRRFEALTGKGFDYQPGGDRAPLDRIRSWWREHGANLKWNESASRFE
jgi:hypothetical protein